MHSNAPNHEFDWTSDKVREVEKLFEIEKAPESDGNLGGDNSTEGNDERDTDAGNDNSGSRSQSERTLEGEEQAIRYESYDKEEPDVFKVDTLSPESRLGFAKKTLIAVGSIFVLFTTSYLFLFGTEQTFEKVWIFTSTITNTIVSLILGYYFQKK